MKSFALALMAFAADANLRTYSFHGEEVRYANATEESLNPRANVAMTKGNLLVTQPNEITTKRFLVEINPDTGKEVQSFSLPLPDGSCLQAISAFYRGSQLFVADASKGVYLVDNMGQPQGLFGDATPDTLGCEIFDIFWDATLKNFYAMVLDPTCTGNQDTRVPNVFQFDVNGKFVQEVVPGGLGGFGALGACMAAPDAQAIWVPSSAGGAMVSAYASKDGTGIGFQVLNNERMAIKCSYHPLSYDVYVSTNFPDNIYILDGNHIETPPSARIAMQGSTPNMSAGAGTMQTQPSTGLLFVASATSDVLATETIQVYDPAKLAYVRGFGGTKCGASGDDYLCMAYNGLTFVN